MRAQSPLVTARESATPPSLWVLPLVSLIAAASVVFLAARLVLARNGLDLTDEGFYLNSLRYAREYQEPISRFGSLAGPALDLVDGDIAWLRRLVIAAVFTSSALLAYQVLGFQASRSRGAVLPVEVRRIWLRLALSLGCASVGSLVFYRVLVTPNYNTLGFLAIQWALAGVFLGMGPGSRRQAPARKLGWVLAGISLALGAFIKPTSAPLVGALLLLLAGLLGELTWRRFGLVLGAAIVSFLVLVQTLAGGLSAYVSSTQAALYANSLRDDGHSLKMVLSLPLFHPGRLDTAVVAVVALTIAGAYFKPALVGWSLVFATAFVTALWYRTATGYGSAGWLIRAWTTVAVLLGAALVAGVQRRQRVPLPRTDASAALVLGMLPFAWAFGTNNNLILHAGWAGYFWVLAALWILVPIHRTLPVVAVAVGQALTILVVSGWYAVPYRQGAAIALQTEVVNVGPDESELLVSSDMARYLTELGALAAAGIPAARTPIIDLTGESPLASFALGGINLGVAWHIGGYPNSERTVARFLSLEPCSELERAWVLSSENGRRELDPSALAPTGLSYPEDYEVVKRLSSPSGVTQFLWRPRPGSSSLCVD